MPYLAGSIILARRRHRRLLGNMRLLMKTLRRFSLVGWENVANRQLRASLPFLARLFV